MVDDYTSSDYFILNDGENLQVQGIHLQLCMGEGMQIILETLQGLIFGIGEGA
jgi:hypothetical protein